MKKSYSLLVTGCAGFIGSNFVRVVTDTFPDAKIIGIDNLSTGHRDAIDPRIVFYEGCICDSQKLEEIFKKHKPEYVVHFAALPRISFSVQHPVQTTDVNIGGTVKLLEKSRDHGVRRFIFSSSSSIYGSAKELPTKEYGGHPKPVSPYAFQKYAGEYMCKLFSDLYGVDTVSLRYFTVFGPGQYGDSPHATIIAAWLTGLYFPHKKELFLEGVGKQSRDFCYVDNVVQANIKAILYAKKFKGEVFNIAHGERTTLLKVRRTLEKMTGRKLDLKKRPARKGDVMHTHADIAHAKKWLKYYPYVNFEEGLQKTVAWFEKLFYESQKIKK